MSVRRLSSAAALAGVLLVAGCNEQQLQPFFQPDTRAPTVQIVAARDSMNVRDSLKFEVKATDNLSLKYIHVVLSQGYQAELDTVFQTVVTQASLDVRIGFPATTTSGGDVYVLATVSDGADNIASAQDTLYLENEDRLTVDIETPQDTGAVVSPGRKLELVIRAEQRDGVQRVWYRTQGVVVQADTVSSGSFPTTLVFTDTIDVASDVTLGTFTIRGYAQSRAGAVDSTSLTTVTVQSTVSDVNPPKVSFQVSSRVEQDDSIKVIATDEDGGGITLIGWKAFDTTGVLVGGDSLDQSGQFDNVTKSWLLNINLNPDALPLKFVICAFGEDVAGNRGHDGEACASSPSPAPGFGAPSAAAGAAAAEAGDTITVVFGITRPLPLGGQIADAIYNRNTNQVLLTNIELDRLEVFDVATKTLSASGIPVGSRPWGIALWPSDTLGNYLDRVVVANSGGTNLSVVDVSGSQVEIGRHHLPNILVETVKSEIDAANNSVKISVTTYDFSDRPQYLGTFCRPTTGSTACAPDSVYALYSTTPTPAQAVAPKNFVNRGTVRWENITSQLYGGATETHFFWEQAEAAPSPQTDTIQVIVDRGPRLPLDTILSAACGITAATEELAFLDTTFVRNSGNFTHGLVGEGGTGDAVMGYARAIGYNGLTGVTSGPCSMTLLGVTFGGRIERDIGISPAIRVRDIVVNSAIGVNSIAINFNGLTNMLRADSIYVLDEGLRLQGLVQVTGANPGMDLNFDHDFNARFRDSQTGRGTTRDDRMVFAATPAAQIDVFDTWYYGQVTSFPIKDPIIGPLRGAQLPGTGRQILVGVTVNGIVYVEVPPLVNSFSTLDAWGGGTP